jgi:hypothetical protein
LQASWAIKAVRYLIIVPSLVGERSDTPTVMQLRQEAADWLSPPDPSVNYHTARDMHHKGTTTWFIESSTFRDWKESGSLLWIHGKRMFPHGLQLRRYI